MPPVAIAVTCQMMVSDKHCGAVLSVRTASFRDLIHTPYECPQTNLCSAASSADALACASMCDGVHHQVT
jgi:hypothetical protein